MTEPAAKQLSPREKLEAAFMESPEAILAVSRALHQEGDVLRKNGDPNWYSYISEAEQGYNQLLNRIMVSPTNFLSSPASILMLLGMMDQQRGWNGRAIALGRLAEAYILDAIKSSNLQGAESSNGNLNKLLAQVMVLQGYGYRGEGYRTIAEEKFKEAIRLDPTDGELLAGFAGLYINDGNPDKCVELLERAEAVRPGTKEEESWNLALAHLEMEHWSLGFELYHKGVKGKERLNQNYWAKGETPTWNGEKGKTVVVYGEQGLGDEIMFMSCIPEMMRDCKKVIIDAHPRLEQVFKRSFQAAEVHGTRKITTHDWAEGRTDIEYKLGCGSLPTFYRHKASDFKQYTEGYLTASTSKALALRKKLSEVGPGPYVGIAWSGGSKKTRFDLRSIPLKLWTPILEQPATFVSIHYMPEAAEAAARFNIPHWQPIIDDMDEQFALVKACDLIISVNQTLVHVAGSLGKTCWTLTPARPAWRYGLTSDKMIWYPSVRQFREGADEQWGPVIKEVAKELKGFLSSYEDKGIQGSILDVESMIVKPPLGANQEESVV